MTNGVDFNEIADGSAADVKAWFRRQVRTHGLRVAYQAAISVCEDPKALASAKATAAGLIFRAAGVLDKVDDGDGTPVDQMTADQLAAEYRRLTAEAADRARNLQSAKDSPSSVFD
jgi:hypothetical protein